MADPEIIERNELICEMCECRLSRSGEVIRRSKKASAMLDLDDANAKLRDDLKKANDTIAELKTQLDAAKAAGNPPTPAPAAVNEWDE